MSDQARIEYDEQRERARAWQREQARKTFAEIDAGAPGHRVVSEEEFEAGWDRIMAGAERNPAPEDSRRGKVGSMSEQARIEYDEQRVRARAWQREQARKTLAEIHAGAPGHGEVSEEDLDAVFDRYLGSDNPKT